MLENTDNHLLHKSPENHPHRHNNHHNHSHIHSHNPHNLQYPQQSHSQNGYSVGQIEQNRGRLQLGLFFDLRQESRTYSVLYRHFHCFLPFPSTARAMFDKLDPYQLGCTLSSPEYTSQSFDHQRYGDAPKLKYTD